MCLQRPPFVFLFFILNWCAGLFAQLPDYHVQIYDEHQGMHTNARRVLRDKEGFLWIKYYDRVQRFDGKSNSEYILNENLTDLVCDEKNRIWVTSHQGVSLFHPDLDRFESVKVDMDVPTFSGQVVLWPGEPVWFITADHQFIFSESEQRFVRDTRSAFQLKKSIRIRKYEFTSSDPFFYYATQDSLIQLNVHTGEHKAMLLLSAFGNFALSRDIVLGCNWKGQAYLYDFENLVVQRVLVKEGSENQQDAFLTIYEVEPLSKNKFILGSENGLMEYDLEQNTARFVSIYLKGEPVRIDGSILDLFLDEDRRLWICAPQALMYCKPLDESIGLIRSVPSESSGRANFQARAFAFDGKAHVWIASSNGIASWNLENNTLRSFLADEGANDKINHPSIRGIAFDGKEVIIGQTNRGVWLYDPVKQTYRRPHYDSGSEGISVKRHLEKDFIDQIIRLHDGRFIIASRDGGYVMDPSFLVHRLEFPGKNDNLNFCFEDDQRRIWIGSKKLYCLDSNLILLFTVDNGINRDIKRCMLQWDQNSLLLGTLGLYELKELGGKITTSVFEPFFANTYIMSMHKDHTGRLWLATDEGLYSYDRPSRAIHFFDQFDNVQGDVFYDNSRFEDNQGRLFLGGTNGINYFYPDSMQIRTDSLHVKVAKFYVNDLAMPMDHSGARIHLTYRQRSVRVEYVAPFFGNGNKLQYRYQLEGFSREWRNVGTNTSVNLLSLSPGNYIFRVAASTDGIYWVDSRDALSFRIDHPFWQTWWFILGSLICILSFAFLMIRRRIHLVRNREIVNRQYEKRISEVEMHALRAQMNPHFMFNSLNSINNFILKNDPDNASGYLTKFSRLMRLILDNSRSEWIVLENELKAIELYIQLEVVRFDEVFDYVITIDPTVDVQTTFVPPMIIQPYVENAIWHGLLHRNKPGGKLTIHLWRDSDVLHIRVDDNGVGRTEASRLKSKSANKHKSHGLQITAERIDIVNRIYIVEAKADITDIVDQKGEGIGTSVLLTLKDKNYDSHHRG